MKLAHSKLAAPTNVLVDVLRFDRALARIVIHKVIYRKMDLLDTVIAPSDVQGCKSLAELGLSQLIVVCKLCEVILNQMRSIETAFEYLIHIEVIYL